MTRILPFRLPHLSRILEIETAAFAQDAYTREMFLHSFRSGAVVFGVAFRFTRIAGYVLASASAPYSEIISIAVDPAYERTGIGAALMRYALRQLSARRVRNVELSVRTTNAAAIKLYRRFGFHKTIRVARYYEDGADAWRMLRKLS